MESLKPGSEPPPSQRRDESVGASPSSGAPSDAPPGLTGREWLAIAGAILCTGTVTLAVLMARGEARPSGDRPASPAAAATAGVARAPIPTLAHPEWSDAGDGRWTGSARRSFAFELPARNSVPVWLRKVRPLLVVRCTADVTEVFVFTDSPARIEPQNEDHTVRYRFDDDPELTERWADSVEHDGLFAPLGPSFAERLKGARTLQFSFTPHNAPPVAVEFDVAGLRDLMEPAQRRCGPRSTKG